MAAGVLQSQAARYGDAIHPIFHAVGCQQTQRALAALDCDVEALMSALNRLMSHGSQPQAEVRPRSGSQSTRAHVSTRVHGSKLPRHDACRAVEDVRLYAWTCSRHPGTKAHVSCSPAALLYLWYRLFVQTRCDCRQANAVTTPFRSIDPENS